MVSTGVLVWTSIRPLIRTFMTVGAGFVLNKANLFSTEATRGGAQLVLNVAMPCLLFSRIVPAFSTHNISSLAPLTVVSVTYGLTGMLMAWTISLFCWVPHRFRYGILAAGCWGNSGDMPAAVALGITASAPFKGVDDQNLAIAYFSMFVLILFITLFPLGGLNLVTKDFEGPDIPSEELQERMYLRRRRIIKKAALLLRRLLPMRPSHSEHPNFIEMGSVEEGRCFEKKVTVFSHWNTGKDEGLDQNAFTGIRVTRLAPVVVSSRRTAGQHGGLEQAPSFKIELPRQPIIDHQDRSSHRHRHAPVSRSRHFLKQLLHPCTVVILLSFVVALADPLKALFIPPSSNFQPHFRPTAPDGQPPLAFIFDTATFIGGACIPLSLICLGSALTGLGFRSGGPYPKGAIISLALGKMVFIPILGVAITRVFTHAGFINRDDKVLQFVCILLSSLPTASTLVSLTQIHSPDGTAEHLPAFLIAQYTIMPFTMTVLVSYTLTSLF